MNRMATKSFKIKEDIVLIPSIPNNFMIALDRNHGLDVRQETSIFSFEQAECTCAKVNQTNIYMKTCFEGLSTQDLCF